jgi:hypothetical protein
MQIWVMHFATLSTLLGTVNAQKISMPTLHAVSATLFNDSKNSNAISNTFLN